MDPSIGTCGSSALSTGGKPTPPVPATNKSKDVKQGTSADKPIETAKVIPSGTTVSTAGSSMDSKEKTKENQRINMSAEHPSIGAELSCDNYLENLAKATLSQENLKGAEKTSKTQNSDGPKKEKKENKTEA